MIKVTKEDFSVDEVLNTFQSKNIGAIVSFIGKVRNKSMGRFVEKLEIELYEEMAKKVLENIKNETIEKYCEDRYGKKQETE